MSIADVLEAVVSQTGAAQMVVPPLIISLRTVLEVRVVDDDDQTVTPEIVS